MIVKITPKKTNIQSNHKYDQLLSVQNFPFDIKNVHESKKNSIKCQDATKSSDSACEASIIWNQVKKTMDKHYC